MKVLSRRITGRILLAFFVAGFGTIPRVGIARALMGHPCFLQIGRLVLLMGLRVTKRRCKDCGNWYYAGYMCGTCLINSFEGASHAS